MLVIISKTLNFSKPTDSQKKKNLNICLKGPSDACDAGSNGVIFEDVHCPNSCYCGRENYDWEQLESMGGSKKPIID